MSFLVKKITYKHHLERISLTAIVTITSNSGDIHVRTRSGYFSSSTQRKTKMKNAYIKSLRNMNKILEHYSMANNFHFILLENVNALKTLEVIHHFTQAPIPQTDKLFECVWPFCEVGPQRVNPLMDNVLKWLDAL